MNKQGATSQEDKDWKGRWIIAAILMVGLLIWGIWQSIRTESPRVFPSDFAEVEVIPTETAPIVKVLSPERLVMGCGLLESEVMRCLMVDYATGDFWLIRFNPQGEGILLETGRLNLWD